jgi:hypothetical protein
METINIDFSATQQSTGSEYFEYLDKGRNNVVCTAKIAELEEFVAILCLCTEQHEVDYYIDANWSKITERFYHDVLSKVEA